MRRTADRANRAANIRFSPYPDGVVVRGGRMEGRLHDREGQTGQARRGGIVSRLLTLGVLSISALMVLAACGPDVDNPYSTTSPASTTADDIRGSTSSSSGCR